MYVRMWYLTSLSCFGANKDMSKSTGNVNVSQRSCGSGSAVSAWNKPGIGSLKSSTCDFLLSGLSVTFGFGQRSTENKIRSNDRDSCDLKRS